MTSSGALSDCKSFLLPFPCLTHKFSQSYSPYLSHQVADKKLAAIYKQLHSISKLKPFFPPWSVFITKLSPKLDSPMYAKHLTESVQITETHYIP